MAGGIYYWQSATYGGIGGTTGGIYRHDFGSFDPTPTPFMTADGSGTCIGCHTLARDGLHMAVMTDDPDADDEMGDVKTHVADVPTRSFLGGKPSPGFQTFSHDHKRMIASTFKNHKNASWDVYDGESSNFIKNVLLPKGMAATQPDLSKTDSHLIFVVPQAGSISTAGDHHFMAGSLYHSSYDATSDTISTPEALLASDGTVNYYYPTLSPDESFIVFNEAADGDAFWNRKARVKLLHFTPGTEQKPLDLPALNADPKIGNSWPRWSPFVRRTRATSFCGSPFLRTAITGFGSRTPASTIVIRPNRLNTISRSPLPSRALGTRTARNPRSG